MAISLTTKLRDEYDLLFSTCEIKASFSKQVGTIITKILANKARYRAAADPLSIPWPVVAAIHNMESSLRFTGHLHNGDPLSARTKNVPANRPVSGTPPFTWEESANDALTYEKLHLVTDWSVSGTLYRLEGYNGWGYRTHHPEIKTPYLWSFSNHYINGKYVGDGKWSATAISEQCGAAVILRRLAELGEASFPARPNQAASAPTPIAYSMSKSKSSQEVDRVLALQRWLNTHAGVFVKLDGVPGDRTSAAFKVVTGRYLPGDRRR